MAQLTSYYSSDELGGLGLASCGADVLISRNAAIYRADRISVGNHVRIDDFVLLTGADGAEVRIGDHAHIAAHAALFGAGGLVIEDFVGVSGRTSIYSTTDDYGGDALTNPTVPAQFTRVIRQRVVLRRHVVVGTGSIVLPGVTIGEGSVTGAMTLVNRDLDPWGIYVGVPARLLRPRSRGLLAREAQLHALEAENEGARGGP
jgi:acetyltransferase-like isoleucine patch superfamily enzyme